MDFPYIAFLWNPRDSVEAQNALHFLRQFSHATWITQIEYPGLAVYRKPIASRCLRTYILPNNTGVIFGTIFSRSSNRHLTAEELANDYSLDTSPRKLARTLTREYWGGFIALHSQPTSGHWCVLRDCSGSLPCYYTSIRGVTLVTSDARNFYSRSNWSRECPLAPARINWHYLSAFLQDSQRPARDTGLLGVRELLAGETLTREEQEPVADLAWNPATFASKTAGTSLASITEELRETTRSCIHAWARTHEAIVHQLSGGFDSSLILALLTRSTPRPSILCVNRYADGPAEDERPYARLASQASSMPLIECPWRFSSYTLDHACLDAPIGAKPYVQSLLYPVESCYLSELNSLYKFDSIWTGEGGDHLFIAYRTELGIIDFIAAYGLNRNTLSIATDSSKLTGTCIPSLLYKAICHAAGIGPHRAAPPGTLHDTPPYENPPADHPWLGHALESPPGKREQIRLLGEVLHRHYPTPGSLDSLSRHPLLSQPLIELCLRIPTYSLLHGGHTRGLARRAFAQTLPPDILHRESKGETTHSLTGILYRSVAFMNEVRLNGTLRKHEFINTSLITAITDCQSTLSDTQILPLCAAVAAEIWLRAWSSGRTP
jgi:asparagine synthase (glutamine-hydrolysing)